MKTPSAVVHDDEYFSFGDAVEVDAITLARHRKVFQLARLKRGGEVGATYGLLFAQGACATNASDVAWHVGPVVQGLEDAVYSVVALM